MREQVGQPGSAVDDVEQLTVGSASGLVHPVFALVSIGPVSVAATGLR
jgi:hypothetical protein